MIVKVVDRDEIFTESFIVEAVRRKLDENHNLQRLQDYYDGRQDILLRVQPDRNKPNNKIVVNYCRSIADFLTAYLAGNAVKIKAPQIILDSLNYNDNNEEIQQIVLNMNIHGFGAELYYMDEDGIPRFAAIDPREAIFVTDDSIEEKITAFIRVYPKIDEKQGYNVVLYFNTGYIKYDLTLSVGELKAVSPIIPHYFRDVPAVLYPNNKEMTGTFEPVMSLQDGLNELVSDELNDFNAFVDAYLVLENMLGTMPEDVARMKQDRILLLSPESKAYWLTKSVNNSHIAELKRSITERIREIGHIPDIENLGALSSGVALRFKLINTDVQTDKQERILYRGLQRKYELLYNIFSTYDPAIGSYTDVQTTFERNFIMLADDKQKEAAFDLMLVQNGYLTPITFLVKHKGMTPEEADEELSKVGGGID